jgi:sugar O-acyltransferase (sialic acid O-acetyltransferase NeuD family)
VSDVVIFGAGKVADVVYHHLRGSDEHRVVAFTCDAEHVPASGHVREQPVVPFEEVAGRYPPDRFSMIVAIGYHDLNALRRRKYDEAKAKGYRLISYVSPKACVGDWLHMGDNCIVLDDAVVEPGTRLGNNVVIWSKVLVGHHTVVEDDVWVAGGATFGGSARIGEGTFVGLDCIVGHEVEIGERSFLGAGAIVLKCCDAKSVFIAPSTERFRLDSERFLKISKLR